MEEADKEAEAVAIAMAAEEAEVDLEEATTIRVLKRLNTEDCVQPSVRMYLTTATKEPQIKCKLRGRR